MSSFDLIADAVGPRNENVEESPRSPMTLILLCLGRRDDYGEEIPLCQLSSTCREMHQAHLDLLYDRRGVAVETHFFMYDNHACIQALAQRRQYIHIT